MSSGPTSSLTIGSDSACSAAALASASSFSRAGISPYMSREASSKSPSRWARSAAARSSSSCFFSSPTRLSPAFSRSQRADQGRQLLLPVGELLAELFQPLPARLVGLLGERELLHLEPVHGALQLVDLHRAGVDLHAQPGGGLVDEVDRLVREEPRGDVAVGERGRGDQGAVGDLHLVVGLVAALEAAQDGDGVLDRRLADVDLLEAALQRRVLLDALAVLVERGRADHAQLAAGEHRLEHVAGVHRALGGAGADHGVQLVDERDDLAVALLDLVEHGLEPLLELAAVLGARDHRAEVERDQPLVLQRLGHVPGDDALGQALDHGGLADAGLADQHRVVLGAPGQHLHHAADLGVPADHRVELAGAGALGEVDAVLLQRLVGVLGVSLVTRACPRIFSNASSSASASRPALRSRSATWPPSAARPTSRCSVETYSSSSRWARARGGVEHGEQLARAARRAHRGALRLGQGVELRSASSRTLRTSAPTASSSGTAVPPVWPSSVTSRCAG